MKNNISILIILSLCLLSVSCNDWLHEPYPSSTQMEDFFTTGKGQAALYTVNGCYSPLQYEYNSTYYPEWFIGDVVSDDALKGGENLTDMAVVYDMENFKTLPSNEYLLDFYRAQYQGIGRCNLGLEQVTLVEPDSTMNLATKNRYLGEMKFLRAMYYFRLLRVYGGVPLVDFTIPSSANWKQPRASAVQIYNFIEKDLKEANDVLWLKNDPRYADTDLGRATKGAAQAMLLKLNLYRAGWVKSGLLKNDEQTPDYYYREAKRWGDSIINSGVYSLCANYNDNFTVMGENGPESVFEIQYTHEPAGDYGQGNGFSRGTFTVILIRSRSSLISNPTGWSFNRPSMDLYREFEAGDRRREVAILMPRPDQIENPTLDIYCGDSCLNNKYALYQGSPDSTFYRLGHAARGPINTKVIRYADVLLMHAEACLETGDLATPIKVINQLRQRARDYAGDQSILPDQSASDYTTATQLLRHERRCELAMEAHRWFDLVRWGVAKEVMDAYKAKESPEARAEMAEFISGKHELFPIPLKEIELNPMEQNPGYN